VRDTAGEGRDPAGHGAEQWRYCLLDQAWPRSPPGVIREILALWDPWLPAGHGGGARAPSPGVGARSTPGLLVVGVEHELLTRVDMLVMGAKHGLLMRADGAAISGRGGVARVCRREWWLCRG
jgi:hypothetical protein